VFASIVIFSSLLFIISEVQMLKQHPVWSGSCKEQLLSAVLT